MKLLRSRSPQLPRTLRRVSGIGAMVVFLAGLLAGAFLIPIGFTVGDLRPLGGTSTTAAIAVNNLTVGVVLLTAGIVTLSAGALVVMLINGILVGQLVVVVITGGQAASLGTGLLPHIALEVAGFALLTACSVWPGAYAISALTGTVPEPHEHLTDVARWTLDVTTGFALLVVAAFVEGTFSTVHFT